MSKRFLQLMLLALIALIFSCVSGEDGSDGSSSAFTKDEADALAMEGVEDAGFSAETFDPAYLRRGIRLDGARPYRSPASNGSGDITGTVVDPRDNTPITNMTVTITYPDGSPAGIPAATTDTLGKFDFTSITDTDYLITLEDPNYITTECWTTVTDASTTTLPPVWFIPHPVITLGSICGKIVDAVTGSPISYATIEFRAGINPPDTEPVLYTTQTGLLGNYAVADMEAGVYTGFASKTGYMDGTFMVYVLGAKEVCNQNGALSPIINGEAMRIILQWGGTPSDLDSHLWAPHHGCESQNPYHLYYVTRGSHGCRSYFDLDLDDVTSYGPETTTVADSLDGLSPRIGQTYRFAVHDYSNLDASYSVAMSNSPGLRVDVITAAGQTSFYMPTNTGATVWSVFDAVYDGSVWTLTPVDQYYYESNPALVY